MKFENKNGTFSAKTTKYYENVLAYAEKYNLRNTLISLSLALELHSQQFRDGGAPYIVHPLEATNYLILLGIWGPILKINLDIAHDNHQFAEELAHKDLDILLSAMLLHDTLEDCKEKLPDGGNEFIQKGLDSEILFFVKILTKDKSDPDYSSERYYQKIGEHWQTSIMKIADRVSNCSTIDSFNVHRMEKYVREIVKYFYPMISKTKQRYPRFSRILTIMKYLIVSITETVASVLGLKDILVPENQDKAFYYLKGSIDSQGMSNSSSALCLAQQYYEGYTRKSGDPFIIHPLRVASYLNALKINDDKVIAAALLHEIIKKCHLQYNGIEIVTVHHLNPTVLDYIRLLANSEHYPLDIYYKALKECPEVLLLRLSNRAHTCTSLADSSPDDIHAYLDEWKNHIIDLCEYGIKHYPLYSNSISVMQFHIDAICNIVSHLKNIEI